MQRATHPTQHATYRNLPQKTHATCNIPHEKYNIQRVACHLSLRHVACYTCTPYSVCGMARQRVSESVSVCLQRYESSWPKTALRSLAKYVCQSVGFALRRLLAACVAFTALACPPTPPFPRPLRPPLRSRAVLALHTHARIGPLQPVGRPACRGVAHRHRAAAAGNRPCVTCSVVAQANSE